MQTQGCKISSKGKLSLLTGWFNHYKEGHHCYFTDENSYKVEGHTINRTFRKSKEQLIKEFEELKFERNVISVIIEELLKTDELKDYFEAKEKLSSLNAKMDMLMRERFDIPK